VEARRNKFLPILMLHAEAAIAADPDLWNHLLLLMAAIRTIEYEIMRTCDTCGHVEPCLRELVTTDPEFHKFVCRKDVYEMCVKHLWYAHYLDQVEQERNHQYEGSERWSPEGGDEVYRNGQWEKK
jgi:hypothetical protein